MIYEENIKEEVLVNYKSKFNSVFVDSLTRNKLQLYAIGKSLLDDCYKYGVLDEKYDYSNDKRAILLENQVQKINIVFSQLFTLDSFKSKTEQELISSGFSNQQAAFNTIINDILKPNVTLNKSITQKALQEELDKVSLARGSIEKGALIISKREQVEGEKYNILKSLEAEYESQIWSATNYNWVIFAYTLLVALALLMLLLFLMKRNLMN